MAWARELIGREVHVRQATEGGARPGEHLAGGRGRLLAAPDRLRTGMTLAGILLVAASTQVMPSLPVPSVTIASVAAALPGVPFEQRIEVNLGQVAATVAGGAVGGAGEVGVAAAAPDQEWRHVYRTVLEEGRQLLSLDTDANRGRGSWAELVGTINEHTETVGILVPGTAAFVLDDNFDKYYQRASELVEASGGTLAMVVWAAGAFPKGWLQGAMTHYQTPLGRSLALFSHELRGEITRRLGPHADVEVVVAGHSFGGAVVGAAERYGMDADAVLHIASAGMGHVRDPYDYPDPDRPRYSITAPWDLIGFVQGAPTPPGLGHGPDPDEFRCVTTLPTGRLPADPTATDEDGEPLGDHAGDRIAGISSHSEVFIPYSDAWWQIYRVFTDPEQEPVTCPPPDEPVPVKARVLPLAVPRVVVGSQCRAGGGLRPGGRHQH